MISMLLIVFSSCKHKEENYSGDYENAAICRAAIKFSNEKTWWYDAAYYKIPYPNGDVPGGGACTDVVIRVLRANGIDLQKHIHEDMEAHFSQYPNKWGLTTTDANIDHRRVPNIMKYFERYGCSLPLSKDFEPGDIICWMLGGGATHIGILLNKNGDVYHNMGPKAMISKGFLFENEIIGHYRTSKFKP